jgi:hypothetical protein
MRTFKVCGIDINCWLNKHYDVAKYAKGWVCSCYSSFISVNAASKMMNRKI